MRRDRLTPERLWTVVLGYRIKPNRFDAGAINDELAHFEGVGADSMLTLLLALAAGVCHSAGGARRA